MLWRRTSRVTREAGLAVGAEDQPTHGAKGLQPLQHRPWRAAVMLHVEGARVRTVAAVDCRLARANRASLQY